MLAPVKEEVAGSGVVTIGAGTGRGAPHLFFPFIPSDRLHLVLAEMSRSVLAITCEKKIYPRKNPHGLSYSHRALDEASRIPGRVFRKPSNEPDQVQKYPFG